MKWIRLGLTALLLIVPALANSAEEETFDLTGSAFRFCGSVTPCAEVKDAVCMDAKRDARAGLPPGCRVAGPGYCECAEEDQGQPTRNETCNATLQAVCPKHE